MREPICLPVEVRPVPGYPNLSVSAAGEVYGPKGRRRVHPGVGGYLYVTVRRTGKVRPGKLRVHHAVLLAWVGPRPDGQEARHEDGDPTNNTVANLSWATHLVNCADKDVHGTTARGSVVGSAKLTESDVRAMRALWPGVSLSALGRRFGVSKSTAHAAVSGRAWRHLSREEG